MIADHAGGRHDLRSIVRESKDRIIANPHELKVVPGIESHRSQRTRLAGVDDGQSPSQYSSLVTGQT